MIEAVLDEEKKRD
jgi:hypothetical protein